MTAVEVHPHGFMLQVGNASDAANNVHAAAASSSVVDRHGPSNSETSGLVQTA